MTTDRILCVQCAVPLPATAKYCRHCGVSQQEAVPVWGEAREKLAQKVATIKQDPELAVLLEPPAPPEPVVPAEPPGPPVCPACGEDLPHSAQVCYQVAPWNSQRVMNRIERARESAQLAQDRIQRMEQRLKMRAH